MSLSFNRKAIHEKKKKKVSDREETGLGAELSNASPEEHVDLLVTDRTPAENVQDPKVVGDARPRISISLSKDALEVVAKTHFIPAAGSIQQQNRSGKKKGGNLCVHRHLHHWVGLPLRRTATVYVLRTSAR